MSAVLQINGLNKSFGGIKATDNLNLSVEKGELHAGPSHLHEGKVLSRGGKGPKPIQRATRSCARQVASNIPTRVSSIVLPGSEKRRPTRCAAEKGCSRLSTNPPAKRIITFSSEPAVGARAACGGRSASAGLSSRVADATPGTKRTACALICGVAAARSKLPSTCSNSSVAPTLN